MKVVGVLGMKLKSDSKSIIIIFKLGPSSRQAANRQRSLNTSLTISCSIAYTTNYDISLLHQYPLIQLQVLIILSNCSIKIFIPISSSKTPIHQHWGFKKQLTLRINKNPFQG